VTYSGSSSNPSHWQANLNLNVYSGVLKWFPLSPSSAPGSTPPSQRQRAVPLTTGKDVPPFTPVEYILVRDHPTKEVMSGHGLGLPQKCTGSPVQEIALAGPGYYQCHITTSIFSVLNNIEPLLFAVMSPLPTHLCDLKRRDWIIQKLAHIPYYWPLGGRGVFETRRESHGCKKMIGATRSGEGPRTVW